MSVFKPQTDEVETFVATESYDGITDTPWESLANRIPDNANVQDMLNAANLNWQVLRLPLFTRIPYDISNSQSPLLREIVIPKSYCLVRHDNHDVITPYMGNRYKPVQNDEAFEVFDQFVRAGEMRMETAGMLHGGKHIWGLASIGKEFVLGNGEIIKGYFLLIQSHAYGYALRAMFTPVRYPGGNSFVHGVTYAMPHSRVFDDARVQEIKEVLTKANAEMESYEAKARFLAGSKLNQKEGVMYLATLFDAKLIHRRKLDKEPMPENFNELLQSKDANRVVKRAVEAIESQPGADLDSCKDTAWGYYQGVVHALDHTMGHKPDTRLEASWLGKNAAVKVRALDLSMVFAEKSE